MSGYGGRSSSRGGGGRGRATSRGGRNANRDMNNGGRGGAAPISQPARLRPCFDYTTTGSCQKNPCSFAHVVKLHASIQASNPMVDPQRGFDHRGGYDTNNGSGSHKFEAVSSIGIWETTAATTAAPVIKIFTGSHDGYWRLWNTAGGAFQREFEHSMGGGKIECVSVASNFLFCGFEGTAVKIPGVQVGMIHAWNLSVPTDPPLEFHVQDSLLPYAHGGGVSSFLTTTGNLCASGSHDGSIRIWNFEGGRFVLVNSICGHAGEVTGLVLQGGVLWSASTDMTIRLWDVTSGECKYLITRDTPPAAAAGVVSGAGVGVGHTMAVTALVLFESPTTGNFVLSASLDGNVKAWNAANGECMFSTNHGMGVVSLALSSDLKGNPLLICGLEVGNIMVRSILQTANAPAFCLLFTLNSRYTCAHENGPVKCIEAGPANTFYTGGADGKLLVWQLTGDLSL